MDLSSTQSWTERLRIVKFTPGLESEEDINFSEHDLPSEGIKSLDRTLRLLDDPKITREQSLLTHEARISHSRNRLAPVHSLPTELFANIILSSLEGDDLSLWTSSRLASLSPVGRRWRNIIVGTPVLWSIVNLQDNWTSALSRSAALPLTIYCPRGFLPSEATAMRVESRLVPEAYRVKNLYVKSFALGIRPLWNLIGRTMPHLLDVELLNWSNPVQLIPISLAPQPNLQRLALMGVRFSWSHASSLPHLDSLSIERSTATVSQLVRLLNGCPALRLLEVVDLEVPPGNKIARREHLIELPRLEELRLGEMDDRLLSPLLERIRAPNLQRRTVNPRIGRFSQIT